MINHRKAINNAINKPAGVNQLAKEIARGRKDPVFFGEHFLGLQFHPRQKVWLWTTTKTNIQAAYNLAKQENIPLPKLEDLLEHDFLKNILAPGNRFGKAQPLTEPILTPTGWKKMGDIKLGDFIYSKNGKQTKVTAIYPQGKRPVYKLTFNDGSWTECDEEHLWEVVTPNNRFNKSYIKNSENYKNKNYKKSLVLTTKEIISRWGLNPKPKYRVEIPMTSPVEFPEKMVDIDPYLLGLLLGDGSITTNSVTFCTNDKELLDCFGESKKTKSDKYSYHLRGLASKLRKLGLLGKKSNNKFIPNDYIFNTSDNRIAILQGLMDTDGCINKNGVIEYSSVSKILAEQVKFIVQSLGGMAIIAAKSTTYTYLGEKKNGQTAYRVTIRMTKCPFRLKRKKELFNKFNYCTTKNRILRKIEFIGHKDCQCLTVEDKSHLYLTRDFIVTHNTFVTSVKHIWYNFYKIGCSGPPDYVKDIRYATLNISPHSMQVDAAYRYIVDIFQDKQIYEWEGKKVRNICKIKSFLIDHKQIKREIVFANNSMIKGVPTGEDQASSLAGTQFFYISYDEAPQSLHLRDELPAKIQSRLLDSGGPMDIIGTPEVDKPSHAYYQRIVKYGLKLKDGFFTMIGGIANNIFIGENEKNSILASIKQTDKEKYRQVAFGDFVSSGAKLFPNAAIEQLWENYPMITMGEPNRKYIIGVDWGFADTGDPSVFYVIDITELMNFLNKRPPVDGVHYRIAFKESVKGASPYAALARLKILQMDFNDADIIHDSSSMGGIIISKMLKEMKVRHLHDFSISRAPKDDMLFYLVLCLTEGRKISTDEDGKVTELNKNFGKIRSFVIPELEEQLGNYRVEDKKLEQDEVMALGMAIWYCEKKLAKHQTKVFDINLLANNSKDVLKIAGQKEIATKELTITERHF